MLLWYKIVTSSLFSVHILQVSKSTKVLIGPSKEQISGLLRCSSRSFISLCRVRFAFCVELSLTRSLVVLFFFSSFRIMSRERNVIADGIEFSLAVANEVELWYFLSKIPCGTHLKWNKLVTDVRGLRDIWILVRAICCTFNVLFIYEGFDALLNHPDRRCERDSRLTQHLK